VECVGEGIRVSFASDLLYDLNADQLRPEGEQNLRNLATTFDRYRDTDLLIVGHTRPASGLSAARQLARLLAGDVYMTRSELGDGSTFIARLPARCPRAELRGQGGIEPASLGPFNATACTPLAEFRLRLRGFSLRRGFRGIR